jgi:hypothetical protein
MARFIDDVRDIEDGDEHRLMQLLVDRLSTVERAQDLVGTYVEARTESLDEAEGELNALLDLVREDLEAAGEDASALSTEELIDAANEGRVSDATREQIRDRFPALADRAASGQAAFESVQPILADIEAESDLYREVADRISEGETGGEAMADRIVAFFERESAFGGDEGTVVDAIVDGSNGEDDPDHPAGEGGEGTDEETKQGDEELERGEEGTEQGGGERDVEDPGPDSDDTTP